MPDRLQLEESMFPVQAFFNAIPDDCFDKVLASLQGHVGYSINDCHCQFPSDLDPDEESFSGVRFSIYEDEVILDDEDFQGILEKVRLAQER